MSLSKNGYKITKYQVFSEWNESLTDWKRICIIHVLCNYKLTKLRHKSYATNSTKL